MYKLIIDTDSYAGNFEREICAYCTGIIGDCGVGKEYVKYYNDEEAFKFEEIIAQVPDDHAYLRPASIDMAPGERSNNSVVIFFEEQPTKGQISIIKDRAQKFFVERYEGELAKFLPYLNERISILKFRLTHMVEEEVEI